MVFIDDWLKDFIAKSNDYIEEEKDTSYYDDLVGLHLDAKKLLKKIEETWSIP